MLKAKMISKMIAAHPGSRHDTAHFLKVYGYASAIGKLEGLGETTQETLELAAILHDISCPYCRNKYGHCSGKVQEMESEHLLRAFLEEFKLDQGMQERIIHLISHHHTYDGIDGLDWQILLEADYLVNADEGNASAEAIQNFKEKVFRTKSGTQMLNDLFLCQS